MTITYRIASTADIPAMHKVRLAVRENRLISMVITEQHYATEIETTGRGWVAIENDAVLGFAIGNQRTGNIWALFVDPAHERRGIGRQLHDTMVQWLFQQSLAKLSLGTAPGTRAAQFYETAGWTFVGLHPDGEALYELHLPKIQ
jgi:GNAT superfamily N-acetyltransferase